MSNYRGERRRSGSPSRIARDGAQLAAPRRSSREKSQYDSRIRNPSQIGRRMRLGPRGVNLAAWLGGLVVWTFLGHVELEDRTGG
jgi:hypothetical protein